MTHDSNKVLDERQDGRSSTSPQQGLDFDPRDLMSMRMRPAEFARLCKVSRQSVSVWIKQGLVTLGPDGLLDPVKASREILARADPARLRARVFREAMVDTPALRRRVRELEQELADERAARARALEDLSEKRAMSIHFDDLAERVTVFLDALQELMPSLSHAPADFVSQELDVLSGVHIFLQSEDEARAAFDDHNDDGPADLAELPLFRHGE